MAFQSEYNDVVTIPSILAIPIRTTKHLIFVPHNLDIRCPLILILLLSWLSYSYTLEWNWFALDSILLRKRGEEDSLEV